MILWGLMTREQKVPLIESRLTQAYTQVCLRWIANYSSNESQGMLVRHKHESLRQAHHVILTSDSNRSICPKSQSNAEYHDEMSCQSISAMENNVWRRWSFLTIEEAVNELLELFERVTLAQSGQFLRRDGKEGGIADVQPRS